MKNQTIKIKLLQETQSLSDLLKQTENTYSYNQTIKILDLINKIE